MPSFSSSCRYSSKGALPIQLATEASAKLVHPSVVANTTTTLPVQSAPEYPVTYPFGEAVEMRTRAEPPLGRVRFWHPVPDTLFAPVEESQVAEFSKRLRTNSMGVSAWGLGAAAARVAKARARTD